MFTTELSKYLKSPSKPEVIVDTRNSYEFNMCALSVQNTWYSLVINPDWSRLTDINKIIDEEFDAETEGWVVLKTQQKELGTGFLPFELGAAHTTSVTLNEGDDSVWLLKLQPRANSRLKILDR